MGLRNWMVILILHITGMRGSGVFTFQQTGRYLIIWSIGFTIDGNDLVLNHTTCTEYLVIA